MVNENTKSCNFMFISLVDDKELVGAKYAAMQMKYLKYLEGLKQQ